MWGRGGGKGVEGGLPPMDWDSFQSYPREGVEGGLPPMDWDSFQSYPILLKYATETKISFGAVNHSSKTLDLARFRFLFDFL